MKLPLAETASTTNMELNRQKTNVRTRTVRTQDTWLMGEPQIDEMLADPIVGLVMRRDNLGPADVRAAIDRACNALRGPKEQSRDVA